MRLHRIWTSRLEKAVSIQRAFYMAVTPGPPLQDMRHDTIDWVVGHALTRDVATQRARKCTPLRKSQFAVPSTLVLADECI